VVREPSSRHDVLIQAHSASLGFTFYEGGNFPPEYRGDAFAAEHGSWNRSRRTDYKIIRIRHLRQWPFGGSFLSFIGVLSGGGLFGKYLGSEID
jgi:glucose/arabinose dehydrogenase